MSRDLYAIEISVLGPEDCNDEDHCEITVEPARAIFDAAVDEPAALFALHYTSGLLGRLVAHLAADVARQRREHMCARREMECSVAGSGLLDLAEPAIFVTVPDDMRADWLCRLQDALTTLAEVEADMRARTVPES